MKKGLLLINLGTPDSTNSLDIKRYLRQFLTDKRVIDIPTMVRYLVVYGLIVPFRSKNTAHAYQSIWTSRGSPLIVKSSKQLKMILIFPTSPHFNNATSYVLF
ncbi:MAG: ferrochelatase [Legionella sp.]